MFYYWLCACATLCLFSPFRFYPCLQLNAYSANNNDYAQDPLNDSTGVEDRQNQIQVSREPPKSQTFPNKAIFSSRERQARLAFANNNRTRRTPEPLNRSQLPLGSVVVVECTSTSPSFISPWRYRDQQRTVGSGFVIMGRRILTNAVRAIHYWT